MARADVAASLAVVVLVLCWPEPAAAQCAMCRRALQSPEGQQLAAAFRSGILVLLAAPFSLVAIVAALVVRMQRSASARGFGGQAATAAARRPSEEHPA